MEQEQKLLDKKVGVCDICSEEFIKNNGRQKICGKKECVLKRDNNYRKNEIIIHTCPICNKNFESNKKDTFRCSPECEKIYRKQYYQKRNKGPYMVNCTICGTEFSTIRKGKNTCSEACKTVVTNNRRREKWNRNHPSFMKSCIICNKEFETTRSNQTTCSEACSILNRKNYKDTFKAQEKEKSCQFCKKTFITKDDKVVVCSDECRGLWREQQRKEHYENTYVSIKYDKICIICQSQFITNFSRQTICDKEECKIENKKRIGQEYFQETYEIQYPKRKAYTNNRLRTDFSFRLIFVMRGRVRLALRTNNKSDRTLHMLSCDSVFFKQYTINNYYDHDKIKMSPETYGKGPNHWQIHHIIPLEFFDLSKPEQQKLAFHYSNTRPVWFEDHIAIHNELNKHMMAIKWHY